VYDESRLLVIGVLLRFKVDVSIGMFGVYDENVFTKLKLK